MAGIRGASNAVLYAFLLWAGLVVTAMVGGVLWEGKPLKLFVLNSSYHLVSMIVAANILVCLR